jgi:hypothetical protein
VYTDGISIQNASPTIENTTIQNCVWGLYLNNSSSIIQNCIIINNDEGVSDRYSAAQYLNNQVKNSYGALTSGNGLAFFSSDPILFGNLLSNNYEAGAVGSNGTYAQFGSSTQTGNNVIRNNKNGIHSSGSNTYLWLGEYATNWGGDNSLYSNTGWDAIALT